MWETLKSKFTVGLLMSPWLWLAVAAALAASHAWVWRQGGEAVRADWNAEKATQAQGAFKQSERYREKEQLLQTQLGKVTNDYIAEKGRRAADAVRTADRLRDYQAALASAAATDPGAAGGAVATITRIAGECAAALGALDEGAKQYRGIAQALQDYARDVCVSPPAAP